MGNRRKRPDEERRKRTRADAVAEVVVDDAVERLGSSIQPVLDLTPEGRTHSWES